MVSNLVDNAVKYTPDAGHITVAVTADGREAVIVVQDDGAGIPSERVDSIFEPFVQLSGSRHAARGGMGLGLSLVRRLIELHGGTVDVTSSGPGWRQPIRRAFAFAAADGKLAYRRDDLCGDFRTAGRAARHRGIPALFSGPHRALKSQERRAATIATH